MNKESIDLYTPMNPEQFRKLLWEMLKTKKAHDSVQYHCGEQKSKNDFVKDDYSITENRDVFEESFAKTLNERAYKRVCLTHLLFRIFALAAYLMFFAVCTNVLELKDNADGVQNIFDNLFKRTDKDSE